MSPGFAPQQAGPAAHARAGDGHRALARSYTTDTVGPPIHELTRNVRPRVARSALDMTRFPTAGAPVLLGPVSPRQQAVRPASRRAAARTGNGNPYLARVLGEAAVAAAKTDTFLGERYRRIASRRGKNKAIVAVGRSILVIIWHLLSDPDARFHDLGATSTTAASAPTARTATTSANSRPSATRSPSNPPPDHLGSPASAPPSPDGQAVVQCARPRLIFGLARKLSITSNQVSGADSCLAIKNNEDYAKKFFNTWCYSAKTLMRMREGLAEKSGKEWYDEYRMLLLKRGTATEELERKDSNNGRRARCVTSSDTVGSNCGMTDYESPGDDDAE